MAAAALHANVLPNPTVIPLEYVGADGPGVGAVNLVARQLPPSKPSAILEQGVGRAPGYTDWERQDHTIHDNPDWYLGVGALFQPADMSGAGGGGPGLRTPIPISTQMALEYIQNREAQSYPGSRGQRTVRAGASAPLSRTAVLP